MHTLPKNEKVRAQWVKFVRTHTPDWEPTEYSYLCLLHFYESCYTCLRLSTLMPAETSQENGESSGPSNKGFQEKRVFVKGSVPTIHQEPNECGKCPIQLLCFQFSQQACYVCLW